MGGFLVVVVVVVVGVGGAFVVDGPAFALTLISRFDGGSRLAADLFVVKPKVGIVEFRG